MVDGVHQHMVDGLPQDMAKGCQSTLDKSNEPSEQSFSNQVIPPDMWPQSVISRLYLTPPMYCNNSHKFIVSRP